MIGNDANVGVGVSEGFPGLLFQLKKGDMEIVTIAHVHKADHRPLQRHLYLQEKLL